MMRILITGGTGFIGHHLVNKLLECNHDITVLTRKPISAQSLFSGRVTPWTTLSSWLPSIKFDAVINLAGAPIIDKAWTHKRKQILKDSRIGITQQLIVAMEEAITKPSVFLSGSAIGIYGDTGASLCTEASSLATDFAAQLCHEWENTAAIAETIGVRTCLLRTGLVLHKSGGLLKKMQLPFSLGLGSRLGSGNQIMSWIHLNDYLEALSYLLHTPSCQGPYNLTAPHPVSNTEFTATLAKSLGRRALLTTPAWALKLALGERSSLLLGGQRVVPEQLLSQGFCFRLPHLREALSAPSI